MRRVSSASQPLIRRLRRGRTLSEMDRRAMPLVAVINDTAARTFFPDTDPIGQRLLMDEPGFGPAYTGEAASYEIVGVIADERLTPFDDRGQHAAIYVSNEQDLRGFGGIIVRTSLDPARFHSARRSPRSTGGSRSPTLRQSISSSLNR